MDEVCRHLAVGTTIDVFRMFAGGTTLELYLTSLPLAAHAVKGVGVTRRERGTEERT
jgi:hypothetical protein